MLEQACLCRKWIAVSTLLLCALPLRAEITCRMADAHISHRTSEVPSVVIPYMSSPPKIDGMIGQSEWKGAEAITGFVTPGTGEAADPQTTAWLGVDQRNLYVAIRCNIAPGYKPKGEMTKRDAQVWLEDSVEFYLRPDTSKREYFQIIVNPVGGQYDGRDTFDGTLRREFADWTPPTRTKTGREKNAWTVEMALPLSSVGLKPQGTRAVRLNFFRSDHWQTWRASSWGILPTPSPHEPKSFGVGIVTFGAPRGAQVNLGTARIADGTGILLVEQRPPALILPGAWETTARLAMPDKFFSASNVQLETRVVPISAGGKVGTSVPMGSTRLKSDNLVKLSVNGLSQGNYRLDVIAKWKGGQAIESLPIMARTPNPKPQICGDIVVDDHDWRADDASARATGVETSLLPELLLKTELREPVTAFDPTDDETITCMTEFQGKLYLGSCTQPMATDTGSVFTYDADLDMWHKVFKVNEEGLVRMAAYGDKLYIPGLDAADGGWELGNIYVHDGKSWVERRTVPRAIHTYGLIRHKDRLYLTADIIEEPPAGMDFEDALNKNLLMAWGSVVSSDDDGKTWKIEYRGTEPGQNIGFIMPFKDQLIANKRGDLVVFDGTEWRPMGLNPRAMLVLDYALDGDTLLLGTQLGLYFWDGKELKGSERFSDFSVRAIRKFGNWWVLAGYVLPMDAPTDYVSLDDDAPRSYNRIMFVPSDILYGKANEDQWWTKVTWMNTREMLVSAECFRGRLYLGTHHENGRVLVVPVVKAGTLESAPRRLETAGMYKLWWEAATPPGTSVAFQVRTAASQDELQKKPFAGPDGKSASYFRQGQAFRVSGPGFIQYLVKLSTDSPARSPYVKRVVVTRN